MTTIDHRILIPAAPDAVWEYVSDISRNPKWQIDCREVIFLTSRREGPGLRWRYATPGGQEYVVAVTAWYKGLGYEYYFVDGTSFRENKGRIRLQEIPEGTIVQWTFTYELGGVLSGMRNALGTSRQIDHTIAESLKSLWQQLKQTAGARSHEAKSLMRDAPDVEARSAYQPRHPSVLPHEQGDAGQKDRLRASEPPISGDDGQHIQVISEPPIDDEDTRLRRAVTPTTEVSPTVISADFEGDPEFLTQLDDLARFEPPVDPTDTKPRSAAEIVAVTHPEPSAEPELPDEPADDHELETPASLVDNDTPIIGKRSAPEETELPEEIAASIDLPRFAEPMEEGDTSSIWEVFGVPRPSESQQLQAVKAEPEQTPELPETPIGAPRVGLRLVLRRKMVRVRRPTA